jgi:hypothetical protein
LTGTRKRAKRHEIGTILENIRFSYEIGELEAALGRYTAAVVLEA